MTPPLGFIICEQPDAVPTFSIMVTGQPPWYVSGFSSRAAAHEWLLRYLTSSNDMANRLSAERADWQREADERLRVDLAIALAPKTEKGKEN